jgi:hypothetical protein
MAEYMKNQTAAIAEEYDRSGSVCSMDDFAMLWIAQNAAEYRNTHQQETRELVAA